MKIKKIICIIISVIVIIGIAVAVWLLTKKPTTTTTTTIITSSTLKDVFQISELSTVQFYYNGVVSVPKKDNPEEKDYSVKYDSTVKAGYDFNNLDFSIDENNKTILPIMPELKIFDVIVDEGSISMMPENANPNLKDVISYCKENTTEKAKVNDMFIKTAKESFKSTIETLLTPVIKESGYVIVWE